MVIILKRKYTIFALLCLIVILLLIYRYFSEKMSQAEIKNSVNNNYTLISINNSVRLYRDDILIQIYDNINPNALPLTDQDNLRSGIKLNSVNEAQQLIEDFDG